MTAAADHLDRLSRIPLFEGLDRKELQAVARSADENTHPAGSTIVREGGGTAGFHLILDGEATVTQRGRTLRTLGPGEYFGEIALIDGQPRSATVTASTPVRTLSVASWNFRPLLEEHPAITLKLLMQLCRRVRELEAARQIEGSTPATG
jgi:CRP-like cAMP-binding protein